MLGTEAQSKRLEILFRFVPCLDLKLCAFVPVFASKLCAYFEGV
jgi:hypothetical protein